MGILLRRPNVVNGSGNMDVFWFGTVVGDNDDGTWVRLNGANWYQNPGSWVATYPAITAGQIPAGRKIVAARVAERIRTDGNAPGYPEMYLRTNNVRIAASRLYLQVPGSSYHNVNGPWVYKSGNTNFSEAEINAMSSDANWYGDDSQISETWIDALYDEPLTAPTTFYPANAATIGTSSVSFEATAPAPQTGQLVRAIWQVASNNTFTTNVKTFYGAWHDRVGPTEKGYYTSNPNDSTNTDLAPGLWYMRIKTQDVISTETSWSATTTFTITHAALPTPINTIPAPGSIRVDPYGIRTGRVDVAASDNRKVGIEWQYSLSNTFASGIVTWKNLVDKVTTGTVSYNAQPVVGLGTGLYGYNVSSSDPSQYLAQATWYMRSRVVDKWNQVSPWSTTDSFTVANPPQAASVTPASNQVIDQQLTPVRWTFSDPWSGDYQTAYQVKVYDANNALIYDSGKTVSTALQKFLSISNTYLYQALKFTVNLWDKDDKTAASVATNQYIFSTSPAITQTFPAQNEVIATGQPTFVWNPGIARPGTSQRSFEIKVYRQDTLALVYTSGEVISTATSHMPPQVILRNNVSYVQTLRIVDTDLLTSTLTRNFSTSYQSPPEPTYTVDVSPYYLSGYATIDWSTTVPDDYFVAWNVYRRPVGATEWTLVTTITDPAIQSFNDWLVPSVGEYEFAVTQLADRSGFTLESGTPETSPSYHIETEDYWLIVEGDESRNIKLYSVVADAFSDEIETNEYIVKGRGRRVNYGTVIGMSGTLSVRIRHNSQISARDQRQLIKSLQLECTSCLLRDPFGNITKVSLGTIAVTRVPGVGNYEFADLEIPYLEVF